MNMPKVAVLGCGALAAESYLPALQRCNDIRCTCLVDLSLERAKTLAATFNIPNVAESLDSIQDTVDGVIIASPNATHADLSLKALRVGKYVLCEKPLTESSRTTKALIEAAGPHKNRLFAGMICRYYPSVRTSAQLDFEKLLGKILEVRGEYGFVFNWNVNATTFYCKKAAGGGVLTDCGCHLIDACLYVLRHPEFHVRSHEDDGESGVEAETCTQVEFLINGRAIPCELRTSRIRNLNNRIEIVGENGTWIIPMSPDKHPTASFGHVDCTAHVRPAGLLGCFQSQCSDFAQEIQGTRTPLAEAQSQVAVMELIDNAYALRKPLTFPWERPR